MGTSNTHDADHWPLQNCHFARANFGNALKCRCRVNQFEAVLRHLKLATTYVLVEGGYVSQRLLAADWQELTGESYIVDIREVDAIYGLKYTLKYLKKAPTVSGYEAEYNKVLKGTRLVQAWGSWYGEARAKEEDEAPKLVCAVCGHSDWIVILQKPDVPLEEYRVKRELMAFFDAKARGG